MVLNYHSNSTSGQRSNSGLGSDSAEKVIVKDELMSDNDSNHSGFHFEATDDFSMDQCDEDTAKAKITEAQCTHDILFISVILNFTCR